MTHVIHSITPSIGPNDAPVAITILGTGFAGTPKVFIGTTQCTGVVRPDGNTLTCNVPADILPEQYDLTVEDGTDPTDTDVFLEAYRVIYPLPELPFVSETQVAILDRMLNGLEASWDVAPGTFVHAVLSAAAIELSRSYFLANDVVQLFFPQYARAGYLNLFGESVGLTRNVATKATGTVTVTGADATVIPVGTKFSTQVVYGQSAVSIEFESLVEGTIAGGTVDVTVDAVVAGLSGNVSASQIVRIGSAIVGVAAVTNAAATSGGTNDETDVPYRIRLLNHVQNPAAGGNKQDYITWALQVENIAKASSVPLGRGDGTVDAYVVDDAPTDGVHATAILTQTAIPLTTQTVTIDTKVYQFQTILTDVDGNVKIGADEIETIRNLINAIKLGPGAGTVYAASMTLHPTVFGKETANGVMTATAKDAGVAGNSIVTTETADNTAWDTVTLENGVNEILSSPANVQAVQDFIAPTPVDEGGGLAPIGADVLIAAPSGVYVGVTVNVTAISGFVEATVIASVTAALQVFFDVLDIGADVLYADIANVVHDTVGVENYSGLLVDWLLGDVTIIDSEQGILGILDIT